MSEDLRPYHDIRHVVEDGRHILTYSEESTGETAGQGSTLALRDLADELEMEDDG